MTRLAPGDVAPEFTLFDADGKAVSLSDYRGRKLVLYFYPAASTPGCTKEACDFRDNLSELNDAGFDVVGISPDPRAKLARFRDDQQLTFPLLGDPSREVLQKYGAYGEKSKLRQDVRGRDPVDVRRRRERQDRAGTVQRTGERARRQTAPRDRRLNRR